MKNYLTILKKALGLNNAENANRLIFNPESGEIELAAAYNVTIGNTGDISRRNGLTATARTESIHSLFCDGGDCFFVLSSALYRLNKDYSAYGVVNGLTVKAKMSYCQVLDRTYYANGFQKGYIIDGVGYSWVAGTYVGPPTHKVFSSPPIGNLITYLSGRMFIAAGTTGWYSEPYAPGWFDLASSFIPFGQRIRMWRGVAGGIYVGLDNQVVFLEGTNPKEFNYRVVAYSPVVEGTDVYAHDVHTGDTTSTDRSVMWVAKDGVYVGQPDGRVTNVTRNKIVVPNSYSGCAVFSTGEYITLFK